MKLSILKPKSQSERKTKTVVDTIMVTPEIVNSWKAPLFQRPVRENAKVQALAEELKNSGGVWPGIVTLGVLDGDVYIIDGQHRRAAFLMSGCEEGYTDVRTHYVESMAEMGEEFVQLNSQLVTMRPDDILRGLEDSVPALSEIRRRCPFVGYDMVRRSEKAPMLSMAIAIRCWRCSSNEVPTSNSSGMSSAAMATSITDVDHLIEFLCLCLSAFGRDAEYQRLWGSLNLILCMWLYRRIVLGQHSHGNTRSAKLNKEQFKKCLMALSANGEYLDWLVGRMIGERDRSPAYSRIRQTFVQRMFSDTGERIKMPQPSWYGSKS